MQEERGTATRKICPSTTLPHWCAPAEIDPGDVNAAKYLDAIRQRMARQVTALSAGPAAATGAAAAALKDQARSRLQSHGSATISEFGGPTVGSIPAFERQWPAPAASQQMPSPGVRV